jgi:iron(III)-enterobactin esterase
MGMHSIARFPLISAAAMGSALALSSLACSSDPVGDGDPNVTGGSDAVGSGGAQSSGGGSATGGVAATGGAGTGGSAQGTGGSAEGTGGAAPEFGTEGDGRFEIGPTYSKDADLNDVGNPKGKTFKFSLSSADSNVYKGDDSTLNDPKPFNRSITVYVPDQYVDGTEAPFLIHHDGEWHFSHVQRALDNLTISTDPHRKLPPFIAIAVNHGGGDSKGSQRGLEYDTMSDRLSRLIEEEVLPAILNNAEVKAAYPGIKFTSDPWGRATMGCSSGGAAALTMAWFHPELYRRVITYSGTFVDQQDDDAAEEATYPHGAWDYHSELELIKNSEMKPLRVFLHVSDDDLSFGPFHNWPVANQNTFDAFTAKGNHTRFIYAKGAGHCDDKVFDETVADSLVWAWRGYPAE